MLYLGDDIEFDLGPTIKRIKDRKCFKDIFYQKFPGNPNLIYLTPKGLMEVFQMSSAKKNAEFLLDLAAWAAVGACFGAANFYYRLAFTPRKHDSSLDDTPAERGWTQGREWAPHVRSPSARPQ